MPLPNEIQQHIRSTIAVKDDQLIRVMNEERREVARKLAAKGLSSSSVRVQRDIEAIELFIDKRMTTHVEIYLDTLAKLAIKIDLALETEIVQHLETLKSAQNATMPPGMAMENIPSMREMYRSRLERADTIALSNAKNRVRLARLKDAVPIPGPQPSIVSHTHNYTASGANARVNVGSTDNSSSVIETSTPPSPMELRKERWSFSDSLALVLFCLACVLALVLGWMEKTSIWAGVTIGGMALLMVYPVLHLCRTWVKRIPVLIAVWALIALFGRTIWPPAAVPIPQPVVRNEPAKPEANSELQQPRFQPKARATAQPSMDNMLPPFVQIKVFNDATAGIVNVGKVPIRDVQIDTSTHTVDKEHPAWGNTNDPPPQVTNSNYWSSAFQVRTKTLDPGERDQFDLTRMAHWNDLPYSQETMNAVSPEKLDEIFRTFFVFRFTFRHAGTGEKYACYRVHGSYLKIPSQVDDNIAQSGAPSMLRFSSNLRNVLIENAKQHYRDGAKEIQCDN